LEVYNLKVSKEEEGLRLDSFLALQEDFNLSRTYLSTLIRNGHVTLDGQKTKPAVKLIAEQKIKLEVPDAIPVNLEPEKMDLDVFFEDEHLLVLNKPAGLVIHPTPTSPTGTLVHGLLFYCKNLSGVGGVLRPGIVHRLDKDTTGLLMVAKDDITHRGLAEQLAQRTVKRRYFALVWHRPVPSSGKIDLPIGRDPGNRKKMAVVSNGRRAVTNFRVMAEYCNAAKMECRLETGRTHQIRVHLSYNGWPIIGDLVYGGKHPRELSSTRSNRKLIEDIKKLAIHQMLHAETLGFLHPVTGEELEFQVAPPLEFRLVVNRLQKEK
jgi:23S rRNA pseudouridine1911/1915/1917 synthase